MATAREKKDHNPATPRGKQEKQGGGQKNDKKDADEGMGAGSHAEMERRERDDRERDRVEREAEVERGEE